jgi:hypothetical protein
MNLLNTFQIASGSTPGRHHRANNRNLAPNQDRVCSFSSEDLFLGLVADGCGSQPHSEYGAEATVRILERIITARAERGNMAPLNEVWFTTLYQGLVHCLAKNAKDNFRNPHTALNTHMMATATGVIVTPETTVLFGAGDPVFVVNGKAHIWGAELDKNAPAYPVMSLAFKGEGDEETLGKFIFRTHTLPTAQINTLAVASDGAVDLLKICADEFYCVPGTDTPVGPFNQFFTNNELYADPETLGIRLNSLAQNWRNPGPPHQGGLLDDDTSLVVIRRKETVSA